MHESIGSGLVGNWLAIIGVLSLIYWGWRITAAIRGRVSHAPAKETPIADALMPMESTAPAEDIAVIAAAVYAMFGDRHTIVHLEAANTSANWVVEGRWMQQTSHNIR